MNRYHNSILVVLLLLMLICTAIWADNVDSEEPAPITGQTQCAIYLRQCDSNSAPPRVIDPVSTTTSITSSTIDLSFLNTTTTTSTIDPKPVESSGDPIAQPLNPIDHADKWDQLAQCESGGNWSTNTGNGFGGGLQFMHQRSYSTWLSFGGAEFAPHPWEATREQQIVIAERVLASSGWGAWPGCTRRFGWR